LFDAFKAGLNRGEIRAAEPDPSSPTGWRVNPWVKKGILLGFRMGAIVDMSIDARRQPFFDKSTYPVRAISAADGVRIVPGGSSIRDGAHIARGVICMPPMFVNVGAYVGENTLIDSHALVGSCAQIGRNCHISAAAQIGGVLEPIGALPVIIEDDVLLGEFRRLRRHHREAPRRARHRHDAQPLDSRVRSGARCRLFRQGRSAAHHSRRRRRRSRLPRRLPSRRHQVGPLLQAAVIVKYRDAKTGSRIQLEDLLR